MLHKVGLSGGGKSYAFEAYNSKRRICKYDFLDKKYIFLISAFYLHYNQHLGRILEQIHCFIELFQQEDFVQNQPPSENFLKLPKISSQNGVVNGVISE